MDYTTFSLAQLKTLVSDRGIEVTQDRRLKASYVDALMLADAYDIEKESPDYDHDEELAREMAIAEGLMTPEESRPEGISEDVIEILASLKEASESAIAKAENMGDCTPDHEPEETPLAVDREKLSHMSAIKLPAYFIGAIIIALLWVAIAIAKVFLTLQRINDVGFSLLAQI